MWLRPQPLFLLFICWLCFFQLQAQAPSLYFNRISQANGLSNNKVNCIIQDRRGFIWIGTDDGLNRYDGSNFVVFKNIPGDSASLSGNTITDLQEDRQGVIWIASADGGLTRYDHRQPSARQFRQYRHRPGEAGTIPVNIINALEEDRDGFIWLATGGASVLRFDPRKELFEPVLPRGGGTIYDICFDKNNMLWAGREGGSIMKVNPQTLESQLDPRYRDLYARLPHMVVTRLFRDSKQHIWFGSWDKAVYRYHSGTQQEEVFAAQKGNPFSFGEDEALSFAEDKTGHIWIGGKYNGLYLYDPAKDVFYNYRHNPALEGSVSSNTIHCIFIDRSGLVWVGTSNGISLHRVNLLPFQQQFIPRSYWTEGKAPVIYDFMKRPDGSLWMGTSVGIIEQQPNGGYRHLPLSYNNMLLAVTKFHRGTDGRLYLGTNYSLFVYDENTGSISLLPNTEKDGVMSRLIESRIVDVVNDSLNGHPVLIVSPYGHFLAYYDLQEQRWVSRLDSAAAILQRYDLRDNLIRRLLPGRHGGLWLANVKNGLSLLMKHTRGHQYFVNDPSDPNSISNNHVYDMLEDAKGNLWLTTYGGGLNYFDRLKRRFTHFPSASNLMEGMTMDRHGKIWILSSGHLQVFDPAINRFQYSDLPDLERSGGAKGYIYQDAKGELYVAGNGYYIRFDPATIRLRQVQPKVHFTDMQIFNHSYSHLLNEESLELKYNQNFFTLHFAAPHFESPAPLQYAWQMDGLNEEWVETGSATQVPFTNLPAGDYVFRVRASTSPGHWGDEITEIRIRIIPPFWKTIWFYAACALLAGLLIYLFYRYRINELLKRQAIRNKIAQDLHDNVGSTLSSISVYSQVARIYHEQDKQQALRDTLEKISSTSSEMISEMNDIVWAINPRNDNMHTILQRMESFARPLLASQGIQFHFDVDDSAKQLVLEMTRRKNFYLIFKESINNAVKYARCQNLWVSVQSEQGQLQLRVRDDGIGFEPGKTKAASSLSGNGLQNMHIRAREMKGELKIRSSAGKGTEVELMFGGEF